MDKICVVTADSNAYYSIISKLKKTGLRYASRTPSETCDGCDLVITTRKESEKMTGQKVCIEDLDPSPMVMRGQLLARMADRAKRIVVGIDPGRRTGVAVFYEDTRVGALTVGSMDEVAQTVSHIVGALPNSGVTVKIGDGDRQLAGRLGVSLKGKLGDALVELVDERGTSLGAIKRGLTRDQSSATKIAFRKGVPIKVN